MNTIRPWECPDQFEYRGRHVTLRWWVHQHEGLVVTQVHIDGTCYPYPHRSKAGAEAAAKRIIDKEIEREEHVKDELFTHDLANPETPSE